MKLNVVNRPATRNRSTSEPKRGRNKFFKIPALLPRENSRSAPVNS